MRVGRVGQHLFEEVDVARVMNGVKLVGRWVRENDDAALSNERFATIHVEEVPKAGAHHQDRVHDRVHVVRTDIWNTHREDVGLALDFNELLVVDVLRRDLVDRLDLAGLDARHLVGGFDALEDLAGDACGSLGQ